MSRRSGYVLESAKARHRFPRYIFPGCKMTAFTQKRLCSTIISSIRPLFEWIDYGEMERSFDRVDRASSRIKIQSIAFWITGNS